MNPLFVLAAIAGGVAPAPRGPEQRPESGGPPEPEPDRDPSCADDGDHRGCYMFGNAPERLECRQRCRLLRAYAPFPGAAPDVARAAAPPPTTITDAAHRAPFVPPVRPAYTSPELRVACPRLDCRSDAGTPCKRQTLGKRAFHLDRVVLAARITGKVSPGSLEGM